MTPTINEVIPTIEVCNRNIKAADAVVERLNRRYDAVFQKMAPRGRDETKSQREAREEMSDLPGELAGAVITADCERTLGKLAVLAHRKPVRLDISRRLLAAATEAQKCAVELRDHVRVSGEMVGMAPGPSPFPSLLALGDQIAAFTRHLLDAPQPDARLVVPAGQWLVEAVTRLNDTDMQGLRRMPGDVFVMDSDVAAKCAARGWVRLIEAGPPAVPVAVTDVVPDEQGEQLVVA